MVANYYGLFSKPLPKTYRAGDEARTRDLSRYAAGSLYQPNLLPQVISCHILKNDFSLLLFKFATAYFLMS